MEHYLLIKETPQSLNNMRKLFTAILLLQVCTSLAQDINFSQFYELPLLRNPSLAGLYKGDYRITGAYRNQWASVSTPFISQALGVETKFSLGENSDNYIALGLQITNDMAGDSKLGRTQFLPVLTFHKSLSEEKDSYLSLGFMGGPVQQRFDPTQLKFGDQFQNGSYSETNPTQQIFSNTNITYLDASVGLNFSSTITEHTNYYIGASYFHFNQPKVAFDKTMDVRLNKKIMLNAGLLFPVSDYHKMILYADYFKQGGSNQMQGGFMFKYDLIQEDEEESMYFNIGSFIRWNDAIIPVVKLDMYKVGLGFTYDVNISKLKAASQSRGGFEVSLSYRNYLNIGNSSMSKVRCPVAF